MPTQSLCDLSGFSHGSLRYSAVIYICGTYTIRYDQSLHNSEKHWFGTSTRPDILLYMAFAPKRRGVQWPELATSGRCHSYLWANRYWSRTGCLRHGHWFRILKQIISILAFGTVVTVFLLSLRFINAFQLAQVEAFSGNSEIIIPVISIGVLLIFATAIMGLVDGWLTCYSPRVGTHITATRYIRYILRSVDLRIRILLRSPSAT